MDSQGSERSDDVEDLHICGGCKQVFRDVEVFIDHKRSGVCSRSKRKENEATNLFQSGDNQLLETIQIPESSLSFANNDTQQPTISCYEPNVILTPPITRSAAREDFAAEKSQSETRSCNPRAHQPTSDFGQSCDTSGELVGEVTDNLEFSRTPQQLPVGIQTLTTSTGGVVRYSNLATDNGRKYKCEYNEKCSFSTFYLKDLERHYRIHTGEKPFKCAHCGRSFNRSDKLKLHQRSHTGEKPYKCEHPNCSYASSDRSSLVKHFRTHTGERPFRCQICPYASRNSSQLVVHLRTHTGDAPFKCSSCPASFKINSDLKRHMRLHTGEKPYGCDLCSYRCAIKGNLRMHKKLNHSNESLVACGQCDYVATSKKLMKEHIREHTTKPLRCSHCVYTTNSRSALNNHNRIHTNEKPYECSVCGYACRQACNLRTHIKKKHPNHELVMMKKRKKKNKEEVKLSNITSNKHKLKVMRAHCQKLYPCHLCDSSFVREDSLRSHIRHHQDIPQTSQTGAALAILQLNQLHEANPSETVTTAMDDYVDFAEPAQYEVETSANVVASENVTVPELNISVGNIQSDAPVPVSSHLYERLMNDQSTCEEGRVIASDIQQPIEQQVHTSLPKRGRPQKKQKTNQQSQQKEQQQQFRIVATANPSNQIVYQLPPGIRIVPFVTVDQQNVPSNASTVLVLNNQTKNVDTAHGIGST